MTLRLAAEASLAMKHNITTAQAETRIIQLLQGK